MRCPLLLVVAFLTVSLTLAERKPVPFLSVHKSVSKHHVVLGESFDVTVLALNLGQAPAFDVRVKDEDPVGGAVHTGGAPQLNFGDNFTLTYTVVPKELGKITIGTATVTYTVDAGHEKVLKAVSNTIREEEGLWRGETIDDMEMRGNVIVMTREEYDRLYSRFVKEIIAYAFLGAVLVLGPYVKYRTSQNQVEYLIRQSKKSK
jgi:hypothetical protein